MHVHCEVFFTKTLANIPITLQNYDFYHAVKTFKIFCLSNLEIYNTVLLAIFTMLFIDTENLVI